jgi:hypothetical protein
MGSTLLTILIVVVVVLVLAVVILLVIAAMKPDTFCIQRKANFKAPPEKIFPEISDFHKWGAWSPWEKLDPNLKRTYSGATSGQGAIYEWEGNKQVGKGRMEIMQAIPSSKISIKLDFLKPFKAHNTAEFSFEPQGESTNVTWSMLGQQPFMFKVMSVFFSMDKMVGKDFEAGLANLKTITDK